MKLNQLDSLLIVMRRMYTIGTTEWLTKKDLGGIYYRICCFQSEGLRSFAAWKKAQLYNCVYINVIYRNRKECSEAALVIGK